MKFYNLIFVFLLIFLVSCSNIPSLPQNKDETWLKYDPTQCLSNPWEIYWLQNNNHNYDLYPRNLDAKNKIMKDYYKEGYDTEILAIKTGPLLDKKGGVVDTICEACSCPQGYTLYVKIKKEDASKMLLLNFKIV